MPAVRQRQMSKFEAKVTLALRLDRLVYAPKPLDRRRNCTELTGWVTFSGIGASKIEPSERDMRATFFGPLPFVLMLFAASTCLASDRVIDRTVTVSPGERLMLITEIGSVAVIGTDASNVTVRAELDGSRSGVRKFAVNVKRVAGGVEIDGHRTTEWWWDWSQLLDGGLRVTYTVNVPRHFHVVVQTAGGKLELRNLQGSIDAHTSGGSVRAGDLSGDIDIRTSGGDIEGERLQGTTRLRTSGGRITIRGASGDSEFRTSGGSMRLYDIAGRVQARTSGGSIDASVLGTRGDLQLRTSGGNINVEVPGDFAATLYARAGGGSVRCDLPLTSRGEVERHTIRGVINGGGGTLSARTSGGSIAIRVRDEAVERGR